MEKPFKITVRVVWWMLLFQALFGLVFTIASVFALRVIFQGSISFLIVLVPCGFFAFFGWSNVFSTIQVTDKSVTVSVFHGRYRINWDEVQKIIRQGHIIALLGNDKRVVLALQLMNVKNGQKLTEYFSQQINERKIEFSTTEQAPLIQHNSRVKFPYSY